MIDRLFAITMADEIGTGGNGGFNSSDEKTDKTITRTTSPAPEGEMEDAVFSSGAAVNFRTNDWLKTSMLFLKSDLIHSILAVVTGRKYSRFCHRRSQHPRHICDSR
jgi:hypothetical protein